MNNWKQNNINNSPVQNYKLISLLKLLIGISENSYVLLSEMSNLTLYRFLEKARNSKSNVL